MPFTPQNAFLGPEKPVLRVSGVGDGRPHVHVEGALRGQNEPSHRCRTDGGRREGEHPHENRSCRLHLAQNGILPGAQRARAQTAGTLVLCSGVTQCCRQQRMREHESEASVLAGRSRRWGGATVLSVKRIPWQLLAWVGGRRLATRKARPFPAPSPCFGVSVFGHFRRQRVWWPGPEHCIEPGDDQGGHVEGGPDDLLPPRLVQFPNAMPLSRRISAKRTASCSKSSRQGRRALNAALCLVGERPPPMMPEGNAGGGRIATGGGLGSGTSLERAGRRFRGRLSVSGESRRDGPGFGCTATGGRPREAAGFCGRAESRIRRLYPRLCAVAPASRKPARTNALFPGAVSAG